MKRCIYDIYKKKVKKEGCYYSPPPVRQAVTVAASVFGAIPGHDTLAFNSRQANSIASGSMLLLCVEINPPPEVMDG